VSEGDILDGDSSGLLEGIKVHSECGTVRLRYAIAERHNGSIEGRPKPDPQT